MPKGILKVNGFRIIGYHGFYPAERKIGGNYSWDIQVESLSGLKPENTEIANLIDYERITKIIESVNQQSEKFIEVLCSKVYNELITLLDKENTLTVKVTKCNVPINGLHSTSYTIASNE